MCSQRLLVHQVALCSRAPLLLDQLLWPFCDTPLRWTMCETSSSLECDGSSRILAIIIKCICGFPNESLHDCGNDPCLPQACWRPCCPSIVYYIMMTARLLPLPSNSLDSQALPYFPACTTGSFNISTIKGYGVPILRVHGRLVPAWSCTSKVHFCLPRGQLRVIPKLVIGVRVHEGAERAAVDDEPCHEGAELHRRKKINLEHTDRVRADRALPDRVDAELRN